MASLLYNSTNINTESSLNAALFLYVKEEIYMATKTAKGLVSYVKTKIGNPYLYGFKQNYAWNRTCTKDNYNN